MYNVLFLGRKDLGYRCLLHMIQDYLCFNVVGVMSNRDTDSVWWGTNDLYKFANKNNIEFMDNSERNSDWLREIVLSKEVNLLISIQHEWIIPKDILDSVGNSAFNLHAAKLPDYKGHNSVNHAILNRETLFTSTIHRMAPLVDMGDIVFEDTFPIGSDDTGLSVYNKSQDAGFTAFSKLAYYLGEGKEIPSKKVSGVGRLYKKNEIYSQKVVDLRVDSEELIERKARAFYFPPFEPTYAILNGRKIHLYPGKCV